MDNLENMWNKLSLLDSEEDGIQCTVDSLAPRLLLAAKFLTKRLTNIEAVARTFKPLWRTQRDFKMKDMRENVMVFEFEDECDLERVLEHEPWTYDKHLVIFERVIENVPISALSFKLITFWIQIHDLPMHSMTSTIRDSIGNSLGMVLPMTDSEEEGGKGNYLRVRVRLDISKPLSRVRKIWSDGRVVGWAALKYERLPNFYYWCGLVTHDERDCEMWLRSKRTLKKEDQQFSAWMRAEADLSYRKTSLIVNGSCPKKAAPPKGKHTRAPSQATESSGAQSNTVGTTTAAIPFPVAAEAETEGGEGNVQNPDFQQPLKPIDDEARYNSSHPLAIDFTFHIGTATFNANNTPKPSSHAKQTIGQPKPNTKARNKTPTHPTHGPTLDTIPASLSAPTVKRETPSSDPKGPQATWKRLIRNPELGNQEVCMTDSASRREHFETEELRPTKRQALVADDDYPLPATVVAVDQPRRTQ
ncbi:uncharacterized protein At4g02000-like [Quercus lobata]|uniref:uncharacterized protein At4g02000-like n=1 Tax=Quercus lobata TaxID=97700 RepID=UPI0012493CD9|nr:uncharacterized protein At4g02000-like [Quercus lobata]